MTCVSGGLVAHSVSAWSVSEFQTNLLLTTVPLSLPPGPNQHFILLKWYRSEMNGIEHYSVINIFCFEKSTSLGFSANPANWDYQTLLIFFFFFIWHWLAFYLLQLKRPIICQVYVCDLCKSKIKYFSFIFRYRICDNSSFLKIHQLVNV